MQGLDKLHHDKLKLAAKVLFELPPAETLPVFQRMSIDNVKALLDQVKDETVDRSGVGRNGVEHAAVESTWLKRRSAEGRGASVSDSFLPEPYVGTRSDPNGGNKRHLSINDFKQPESIRIDERIESNDSYETDDQANSSLAGMKRFALLSDDEIRAILKHCDTSFWAPALKNAPVAIKQKIMNCMAPAAVGLLKLEIDKLGSINKQDEKRARQGIVHTAFRLATGGQIMIEPRSNEAA